MAPFTGQQIKDLAQRLTHCRSGNATLMLALTMPVLIGGAGVGIDISHWYLWKRELQFAVDQGAIAAAWAKAQDEDSADYLTRALQEYEANLALTRDLDTGPTITLEDYDGGTDNSIQVSASATGKLPFTSFMLNRRTTIGVRAQAIYEPGTTFDPCLIALDPTAARSMWFHGGPTVTAKCGIGALSTAANSISFEGAQGDYDIGFAATAGEVSDPHGHMHNAAVIEGVDNLVDPFAELEPPDNSTQRTYQCGETQYSGDRTIRVETSYSYRIGPNPNNSSEYSGYPNPKQGGITTTVTTGLSFNGEPQDNTATHHSYREVSGKGNNKIWEKETSVTQTRYSNLQLVATAGQQLPGTYASMNISCDTTLAPGVYVIDGGMLSIESQYELSGTGVMIVLKNGAGIKTAGGAEVNLTAMDQTQLQNAGVPAEDLERMEGLLIFEDPDSPGNDRNRLTGNSSSSYNGTIYLPKSNLVLVGNPRGATQCVTIAARTLEIGGTASLSSMCPDATTPRHSLASQDETVRLIR